MTAAVSLNTNLPHTHTGTRSEERRVGSVDLGGRRIIKKKTKKTKKKKQNKQKQKKNIKMTSTQVTNTIRD